MEGYDPNTLSKEEAKAIWQKIKPTLNWCRIKCARCRSEMYIHRRTHLKREETINGKKTTSNVEAYDLRCTCGHSGVMGIDNYEDGLDNI